MIGQLFGNYRALSLLGKGGMGAVYLAEHPEIGRKVAVKVLHTELTTDVQLLGRFLNEARAANAIRHPNIIEILDSGTLPSGAPFLVMELLEGESLAGRIARVGRIPLAEAVEFTYQTASALGAAHKAGIVHRDLKPDNVFIIPSQGEGERERVKVLDFGIAKLQRTVPGDSVKTRTGMLMGTPVYMSPEQCRGTKSVDLRSDVYSLGIMLYEMLVGRPPFVSEGFGDLVNMHLNLQPAPVRSWLPNMPESVEQIVQRTLAKNPDDRFQTMADLQTALKRLSGAGFVVQGSSPNLTAAKQGVGVDRTLAMVTPVRTTFSTGTGEMRTDTRSRGRTGLLAMVGVAAAVVAGGAYLLRGGETNTAGEGVTPPATTSAVVDAAAQPSLSPSTPSGTAGTNSVAAVPKDAAVERTVAVPEVVVAPPDPPRPKTNANAAGGKPGGGKPKIKPTAKGGGSKRPPAEEEPAKL